MTEREKRYLIAEPTVAWGVAILLTILYCSTLPPTVSYWDCPEYVAAAYCLEVGHPPGNPTWMLVGRVVSMLAPAPEYAALAINVSSALFTAFAGFFLAKTIFRAGLWVLLKLPRRRIPAPIAAGGAALCGSLAFGLCDSAWYSAVEAEVYAMSIFMTALCVWLMVKWVGSRDRATSWKLLILIAYLFGLSIGIHQLNLLCIPALAIIWAIKRGIRSPLRTGVIFLLSLGAVACVLKGMMPATIDLAAQFELFAVNTLNLPALSGVAAYVVTLGLSLIGALTATTISNSRAVMGTACFPAIFLSGIFCFSDNFAMGAAASALAAFLLVRGENFRARRLNLSMWMLAMLLTGYSSYALIPIRGSVPSPANSSMPGEPFAFAAYQGREQYGSKPLLYGATPLSRAMFAEDYDPDGNPVYRRYYLTQGRPLIVAKEEGARLPVITNGADTADNKRLTERPGDAYITRGIRSKSVTTPELDMWFPRITGQRPSDLVSYAEWIGMDSSSMTAVRISEAFDSLGHPVGRADGAGNRVRPLSYRPTYLQNAQWFAAYQTGYMYWRYLLWNFCGRQNDIPSQGEVQHGNFITGYPLIDNAMLGADSELPDFAGSKNPGRNPLYMLPLLLGLLGMGWLLHSRRRGIQVCTVTAILFLLTGLAITVYLNQGPNEPRERDYSFLGSFWAYALWIGFGALMIARRLRSVWGFLPGIVIVAWMGIVNYDDHDRSGRMAARNITANILNSAEPNAIIFVNGDNWTFPLWYAQEVEGIRTDVRIVNLAYLNTPVYTANLMKDWRDSKALSMTLTRQDIIWEAFRNAKLPASADNNTIVSADSALRALRLSSRPAFSNRRVELRVSPDSTIIYDLRKLLRQGSGESVDFGRLMMFDIIATNAASDSPRPVYWVAILGPDKRVGLTEWTSPWIFGKKFGIESEAHNDSLLVAAVTKFLPPNRMNRKVYMDHTPAMQVSYQRGHIASGARRLLSHGRIDDALKLARIADRGQGEDAETFVNILAGDSVFRTRREIVRLLRDISDSIEQRGGSKATVTELRGRSRQLARRDSLRDAAWDSYRRALPPRLRGKMAPTR